MDKSHVSQVFGKELKRVREASGLSQEALALDADLDRSYLSKLERGIRQPTITVIFKLCDSLSYEPDKLVKAVRLKLLKSNG